MHTIKALGAAILSIRIYSLLTDAWTVEVFKYLAIKIFNVLFLYTFYLK